LRVGARDIPGGITTAKVSPVFQDDWLARCQELIDKYEPRMLWFDNGVG
jgi:alpha-L-fucosidase